MVLRSQAESLLVRGLRDRAAHIYARSDADFDMVILRLLDLVPPLSFPVSRLQGLPTGGYGTGTGTGLSGVLRNEVTENADLGLVSPQSSSSSAALLQYLLEKLSQLVQGSGPGLAHSEISSSQVKGDSVQ